MAALWIQYDSTDYKYVCYRHIDNLSQIQVRIVCRFMVFCSLKWELLTQKGTLKNEYTSGCWLKSALLLYFNHNHGRWLTFAFILSFNHNHAALIHCHLDKDLHRFSS